MYEFLTFLNSSCVREKLVQKGGTKALNYAQRSQQCVVDAAAATRAAPLCVCCASFAFFLFVLLSSYYYTRIARVAMLVTADQTHGTEELEKQRHLFCVATSRFFSAVFGGRLSVYDAAAGVCFFYFYSTTSNVNDLFC